MARINFRGQIDKKIYMTQKIKYSKKIGLEVEFNTENIIEVNKENIKYLKEKVSTSPRKRYRLCLHRSRDHFVNEMVIVRDRSTYMRPHKHPKGRDESYYII